MGLFSRKKIDEFVSPANGELIHLDKVNDPVFSQKLHLSSISVLSFYQIFRKP